MIFSKSRTLHLKVTQYAAGPFLLALCMHLDFVYNFPLFMVTEGNRAVKPDRGIQMHFDDTSLMLKINKLFLTHCFPCFGLIVELHPSH